jgi:hypothetical protein
VGFEQLAALGRGACVGVVSRRRAARGLLAMRGRGGVATLATSSSSRSTASSRLRAWVRCSWALMTITPSLLSRWSRSASSRALCGPGRLEPGTSKRRWTALDTLLTF